MKVIKVDNIDNTLPSKFIHSEGYPIAVINIQIATALNLTNDFTIAKHTTMNGSKEIYYIGEFGGCYIYVDPSLTWDNNVITMVETPEKYKR